MKLNSLNMLTRQLGRRAQDQSGAVTVDWVVIMSAIVVLGTVIVGATSGGMEKVANEIDTELSAVAVN